MYHESLEDAFINMDIVVSISISKAISKKQYNILQGKTISQTSNVHFLPAFLSSSVTKSNMTYL